MCIYVCVSVCTHNGTVLRHKKNEITLCAATWMDLEKTEKDKCHMLSLICVI